MPPTADRDHARKGDLPYTDVLELCRRLSNWRRWGDDDQLGTLNFVSPQNLVHAAGLVKRGRAFSLAIPIDDKAPLSRGSSRFHPIHLMIRDGADHTAGSMVRDFQGGVDRHNPSTDDIIIMPTQSGTHWDGLGHALHDGHMYNGYDANWVSSKGAMRNGIEKAQASLVGRGVLLDVARFAGKDCLDEGYVINAAELEACCRSQRVEVGRGDILLIRTGRLARTRMDGTWGSYADTSSPAPGMGISSVDWLHHREVAAAATDTYAFEVLPCESTEIFAPVHIVAIVYMGLTIGEIFDLDALAEDCAGDGVYEFLFAGSPLPITGAVGSPVNPIALK